MKAILDMIKERQKTLDVMNDDSDKPDFMKRKICGKKYELE